MVKSQHRLFDTLDLIFLGTIGLGTIAWFARNQIFKSNTQSKPETRPDSPKAPPKKERNFVKVMQQQVKHLFSSHLISLIII